MGKVAGLMLEVRGAAHLCRLACIRLYACHRCRVPPVHLMCSMSTACERDESAFILVHAVLRLVLPRSSTFIACAAVSHLAYCTPDT